MGSPPWITDRDLDFSYLLGPFDAKRMIRLEGLRHEQEMKQAIIGLQTRFPPFDRNLTYYSTGAQVNGGATMPIHAVAMVMTPDRSLFRTDEYARW